MIFDDGMSLRSATSRFRGPSSIEENVIAFLNSSKLIPTYQARRIFNVSTSVLKKYALGTESCVFLRFEF